MAKQVFVSRHCEQQKGDVKLMDLKFEWVLWTDILGMWYLKSVIENLKGLFT
jgi:hypothetical protein